MALLGTFNTEFSLENINFDTDACLGPQEVNFKTCFYNGRVLQTGKIISATTEYWNSKPSLIAEKNTIYIYTDYRQKEVDGQMVDVAGMKLGDGLAYLIDIPFTDEDFLSHIQDAVIHITQEERAYWNSKVRAFIDSEDAENLILIP